ncbi:MAG: hypothetical protein ACOCUU_03325 [Nanoarchaeota archaeon]
MVSKEFYIREGVQRFLDRLVENMEGAIELENSILTTRYLGDFEDLKGASERYLGIGDRASVQAKARLSEHRRKVDKIRSLNMASVGNDGGD